MLAVGGCHKHVTPPPAEPAPKPPSFTASRIRSFSDSFTVTAIGDSPAAVLVGTPRGLLRWEGTRSTLLTSKEGLPADRVAAIAVDPQGGVLVATAKGLSRGFRNAWSNWSGAPVGEYLTGLVSDGKTVWAAGPEGLGRLRAGKWEHFFADTGITALAPGYGNTVWVGTDGSGVLRVARGGEKVERFGASQGCETDVVRGMVAVDKTLLVIGEGPAGPRAAYFDGERFYSYELASPTVLEWAERAGARTLVGAGDNIYTLGLVPPVDPKAPPGAEQPPPNDSPVQLRPIRSYVVNARTIALKPDLPSTALDDPPNAPKPPKAVTPPQMPKGSKIVAAVGPLAPEGPLIAADESPIRLPEGVTAVGGSERGLLVGTRFLGALRIENDVPRRFRVNDLVAGAVRLTVACNAANKAARRLLPRHRRHARLPLRRAGVRGRARRSRAGLARARRAARSQGRRARHPPRRRQPAAPPLARRRRPLDADRHRAGRRSPSARPSSTSPSSRPTAICGSGLRYLDADGDARDFGADEIALDSGKVVGAPGAAHRRRRDVLEGAERGVVRHALGRGAPARRQAARVHRERRPRERADARHRPGPGRPRSSSPRAAAPGATTASAGSSRASARSTRPPTRSGTTRTATSSSAPRRGSTASASARPTRSIAAAACSTTTSPTWRSTRAIAFGS